MGEIKLNHKEKRGIYINYDQFIDTCRNCIGYNFDLNKIFTPKIRLYLKDIYYITEKYLDKIEENNLHLPTGSTIFNLKYPKKYNWKQFQESIEKSYNIAIKYEECFLQTNYENTKLFEELYNNHKKFIADKENLLKGTNLILIDNLEPVFKAIRRKTGIYKLYNKNKKLIYIGKSINLENRLVTSAKDKKAYYFKYTLINNKPDTDIYEIYYIAKFKPEKNKEFNDSDKQPTIKLPELKFSNLYQIFKLPEDDVNDQTTG